MKRLILVITIFSAILMNGQGLKTLDTDFGIKKFKLETPFSTHKKDLEYFDMNSQGIEFYKYTKSDIKEVFGIPIKEIGLCFFDNKLYCKSSAKSVLI